MTIYGLSGAKAFQVPLRTDFICRRSRQVRSSISSRQSVVIESFRLMDARSRDIVFHLTLDRRTILFAISTVSSRPLALPWISALRVQKAEFSVRKRMSFVSKSAADPTRGKTLKNVEGGNDR